MPAAYSIDLRKRVIDAVKENKLKIKEISAMYKVSTETIRIWRRQLESEGALESKKTGRKVGSCRKIKDDAKFKEFLDTTDAKTQKQMAENWGGVSQRTICRAIQRINYTFKKKPLGTQNATKKTGKPT